MKIDFDTVVSGLASFCWEEANLLEEKTERVYISCRQDRPNLFDRERRRTHPDGPARNSDSSGTNRNTNRGGNNDRKNDRPRSSSNGSNSNSTRNTNSNNPPSSNQNRPSQLASSNQAPKSTQESRQNTIDKGDRLQEKMERMVRENEAKKVQSNQPVSSNQDTKNTPTLQQKIPDQNEQFLEKMKKMRDQPLESPVLQKQKEIARQQLVDNNPYLSDKEKQNIKTGSLSLPETSSAKPLMQKEFVSIHTRETPSPKTEKETNYDGINIREFLDNVDDGTNNKELVLVGSTPVFVDSKKSELNEKLQNAVNKTKEVFNDARKGLEQSGPMANIALGIGEVIIGGAGVVESTVSMLTTVGSTTPIAAPAAIVSATVAVDGVARIADGLASFKSSNVDQKTEHLNKKPNVRTKPKNLEEKLALKEAKSGGGREFMEGKIKDPKFKQDWKKMRHSHANTDGTNIEIHFWENKITGERIGFKFKNP